jgi:hypothetical protein
VAAFDVDKERSERTYQSYFQNKLLKSFRRKEMDVEVMKGEVLDGGSRGGLLQVMKTKPVDVARPQKIKS